MENNCTCASFFTIRGKHKQDCPLNDTKDEGKKFMPTLGCNCEGCEEFFAGKKKDEPKEWEDEFRKIFTPTISKTRYEGCYMLNVPYEEMVHWVAKTIAKEREEGYKKGYIDGRLSRNV
jgi:hypothetical protein